MVDKALQSEVITDSMKVKFTNKRILDEMEKAKTNMLAVVDRECKFVGVMTQEEIVIKILIKLLGVACILRELGLNPFALYGKPALTSRPGHPPARSAV